MIHSPIEQFVHTKQYFQFKQCLRIVILVSLLQCFSVIASAQITRTSESASATTPAQKLERQQVLIMLNLPAQHYRPDFAYSGNYRQDAARSARRKIAEKIAHELHLKLVEDWPMPILNIDCFRMELLGDHSMTEVIEKLNQDKRVVWAQSVSDFETKSEFKQADPLSSVQPAQKFWSIQQVHRTTTGKQVIIAVVDSAIEMQHTDLRGQILFQENFIEGKQLTPELHGTQVAGVIVAKSGNHLGISGVAPDARLMALRACTQDSNGKTMCNGFAVAKAIHFAITKGAHIINLSFSGPDDRLIRQLIDAAVLKDIKIVAAFDPLTSNGGFPALHPNVFSVADKKMPSIQTTLQAPMQTTLIAPGRDIPTTSIDNSWSFVSGSSFSSAHVSGMLALINQLKPHISSKQVRDSLIPQPDTPGQPEGLLSLCGTIKKATLQCVCTCKNEP
jgi:subtilisin family serine protease